MKDDNEIMTNLLFTALSDAGLNYNKSIRPNLKKEDHEIIKAIYTNIEASIGANIHLNYPDFNIKNISPLSILDTFLQQEHGIKFTKEEIENILNDK